jgi:hypothetical protein
MSPDAVPAVKKHPLLAKSAVIFSLIPAFPKNPVIDLPVHHLAPAATRLLLHGEFFVIVFEFTVSTVLSPDILDEIHPSLHPRLVHHHLFRTIKRFDEGFDRFPQNRNKLILAKALMNKEQQARHPGDIHVVDVILGFLISFGPIFRLFNIPFFNCLLGELMKVFAFLLKLFFSVQPAFYFHCYLSILCSPFLSSFPRE